jgi:hypothetical protein
MRLRDAQLPHGPGEGNHRRPKKLIGWDSKWGPHLASFRNHASRGDKAARAKLLSRPDPSPDALPYWLAFHDLSRDRPVTGGMVSTPRNIPLDAIRAEATRLGHVGDGFEIFVAILRDIDNHWLQLEMARLLAESKKRATR